MISHAKLDMIVIDMLYSDSTVAMMVAVHRLDARRRKTHLSCVLPPSLFEAKQVKTIKAQELHNSSLVPDSMAQLTWLQVGCSHCV